MTKTHSIITIAEIAKDLGITDVAVGRHVRKGHVKASNFLGRWIITPEAYAEFKAARAVRTGKRGRPAKEALKPQPEMNN